MIDLQEPKYQWGQRVRANTDLFNDGSYPDKPVRAVPMVGITWVGPAV